LKLFLNPIFLKFGTLILGENKNQDTPLEPEKDPTQKELDEEPPDSL
jgi:hypothetical protein